MITLDKILVKKDEIEKLVKKFGFNEQVKIYNESSSHNVKFNLNFIVNEVPGRSNSYKVPSYLQAKLVELLGCKVNIIVYDQIPELYRYHHNNKSALLADIDAVCKLFEKNAAEIIFNCLNENDKEEQKILVTLANEYLKERSVNVTDAGTHDKHSCVAGTSMGKGK